MDTSKYSQVNLSFSAKKEKNKKGLLFFEASEPTVPLLEHLFDSLIQTDHKLQELGFTYYNGKIFVIENKKEDTHA